MKVYSRILSLALVFALAFGLVVTAGAKTASDYPDKDSITPQYAEAVDVLTALGVFQGDESGNLGPQDTFTRAQAAKIVTYISIGTTAADRLSPRASSFTDVPTTHWANPFIEYAVEKGIINGVGGGKFDPDSPVTGAQFSKLMLAALGYGAKNEYVGSSWELNAIVDGQKHGILTINTDYSAPAKREEAIAYTFNTIAPGIVGVSKNFLVKFSTIINDYVLANGSSYAIGDTGSAQWLGVETFGLTRDNDEDGYGFTGHYWVVGPNRISDTFYKDGIVIAELTSNGMVSKGYAYSTYKWADTLEVWTNGDKAVNVASSEHAERNSIFPAFTGTGWAVSLLDMDYDGKVDKLVISYGYLAKVTKVNAGPGTIEADFYYRSAGGKSERKIVIDGVGFAVNDYIVVTPKNDGANNPSLLAAPSISDVLAVEKANIVTGKTTSYSTDKSFGGPGYITGITVAGKTYNVASVEAITYDTSALDYGSDVVLYLDSNDYIIGYDGAVLTAASLNYLYITGTGDPYGTSALGDRRLGVTYTDGTKGILEAALKSDGTFAGSNGSAAADMWFAYTLDTNGKVILQDLSDIGGGGVAVAAVTTADYADDSTKGFKVAAGQPKLEVGSSLSNQMQINAGYATSSTVLRISGRTYTGYRNFPEYTSQDKDSILVIFAQKSDGTGAATTTIAAIYIAASGPVKSGEYGVVTFVGGSVAEGWQYTVKTIAEPDGITLVHPGDTSAEYAAGAVVEIVPETAGGEKTIGASESELFVGEITGVDGEFAYILTDGSPGIYYLASDVMFVDTTAEAASNPKVGDLVYVYGTDPNSASAPAYAVVKTGSMSALYAALSASISSANTYKAKLSARSGTFSFDGELSAAVSANADPNSTAAALSAAASALDAAVGAYQNGLADAKGKVGHAASSSVTGLADTYNRTAVESAITGLLDSGNTNGYLATAAFTWSNDTTVSVAFADSISIPWELDNAHTM
jgi:hypothetical protein